MRTDRIFSFLQNITANNNREYFNQHKEDYLNAKSDFEEIVAHLIKRLSVVDSSVANLQPKECIYRIYRDIRFSPDKSPYKRHFGAFIAPKGGHRSILCGYYLHFQPGNTVICTGTYGLDKNQLAAMRSAIYGDYEEFSALLSTPDFKNAFGNLVSASTTLKKVPVGYPADFEGGDLLRLKDYDAIHSFMDNEVLADSFVDNVERLFVVSAPFCMYVNEVLTQRD